MSSIPKTSVRHDLQEALWEGSGQGLPPGGEGELCAEVRERLLVQDLSRSWGPLLLPEQKITQPSSNRIKLTASNTILKVKAQKKDKSHQKKLVIRSQARFSKSQYNLQVTFCSRSVSFVSPLFSWLQLATDRWNKGLFSYEKRFNLCKTLYNCLRVRFCTTPCYQHCHVGACSLLNKLFRSSLHLSLSFHLNRSEVNVARTYWNSWRRYNFQRKAACHLKWYFGIQTYAMTLDKLIIKHLGLCHEV